MLRRKFSIFIVISTLVPLLIDSTMAPKTKLKTPASTQKRGRSVKSKTSQTPLLFPKPHSETDLSHNEDELTRKDVMMALGSTNSRLAAHDVRLDEMASQQYMRTYRPCCL